MPLTAIQPSFKKQQPQQRHLAEMSAVASAGQSAAIVSFQRHHGSVPPTQNADSAPSSLNPAGQFSGSIAIFAQFAA